MSFAIQVRDYQISTVDRCRQHVMNKTKRILIQMACGGGKTIVAAIIIKRAAELGKRCLFLAGARELIHQCSRKLQQCGVQHGIIMAGHAYTASLVQVASKDTLLSRAFRQQKISLPRADLVFVDEAHLAMGSTWSELLNCYPDAIIIGLTATPSRQDGKGLGDRFDALVQAVPTSQLLRDGFLVPLRYYAPHIPNLKGVGVQKGDYVKNQLAHRMDKPQLIGNIVSHWRRLAQDRPTVAFAVNIAHSKHITEEFQRIGVRAAHIDGKTPSDQREEIFKSFEDGHTQIVSSCNVLHTGIDFPWASCGIMARPTRSFELFLQMAGRLMRPYDGPLGKKTDGLLLDHAGLIYRHGFPDDDIEWPLLATQSVHDNIEQAKDAKKRREPIRCKKCHAIFANSATCPQCGWNVPVAKTPHKDITHKNGVLVQVSREDQIHTHNLELAREWHRALGMAAARDQTASYAAAIFKSKTGILPWNVPHLPNLPQPHDFPCRVRILYPHYYRPGKAKTS